MSSIIDKEKPEVRKIQTIHGNTTFVLVIPRDFVERLNITKGDYVKCTIADGSLVVRKADL
jgi:antitoxin component of MazEF toxin-antitoxin module